MADSVTWFAEKICVQMLTRRTLAWCMNRRSKQAAAWFAFEQKYTLRTWICYGILASSDKLTCKQMTLSWHRSISVWQRCQDCHGESALKEKQFPFWNVLFQCYVLPATYSLFVQCQMVQNLLKAKSHFMCGKLSWGKTFLRDDIFRLKNGEYEGQN